jgi:2-C-methyl-D-erythritol 4-phosphate cytidylyltransferase
MTLVVLILAAGSGERLGAGVPKALVPLCGRPLMQWSVDVLRAVRGVDQIVVALPEGVAAPEGTHGVRGGAVRSESVREALSAVDPGDDSDLVLVHDAARPLLTPALAESVIAALHERADVQAAIAAAPVTDTVKRAEEGTVVETLDRSKLWAIQTPQVFRRAALQRALEQPAEVLAQATDDAWLIERDGGRVAIVPASAENIKVTTALDLELATLLIERRERGQAQPAELVQPQES